MFRGFYCNKCNKPITNEARAAYVNDVPWCGDCVDALEESSTVTGRIEFQLNDNWWLAELSTDGWSVAYQTMKHGIERIGTLRYSKLSTVELIEKVKSDLALLEPSA